MNSNTRRIKRQISKASRKGNATLIVPRPVRNYHTDSKMTNVTYNCAVPNKEGVVSLNPARNTQMVIYTNVGADGKRFSVTRHERINAKSPIYPKNHVYINYRTE